MRVTVAQVRARFPRLRELTDERIASLIDDYWPRSPLDDEANLPRQIIDDTSTIGSYVPMEPGTDEQRPRRNARPMMPMRIEGDPPPEYIPPEVSSIRRLGIAETYLDSYGPRTRQRTQAEAQALANDEPTYGRHRSDLR